MIDTSSITRRNLLLGGLLTATAAVTFARMPRTQAAALSGQELDDVIPSRVGTWIWADSDDIVVAPEMERKETRAYDDLVARSYQAPGSATPVMMLIAYDRTQSGMLQIHRPEACYPAAGYALSNSVEFPLTLVSGHTVRAHMMTATAGARSEQVLYWTRVGDDFPPNYDAQRTSVAKQNLRGLIPDGALVRLSVIDPNVVESRRLLTRFAQTLYATMGRDGRALLTGPSVALA